MTKMNIEALKYLNKIYEYVFLSTVSRSINNSVNDNHFMFLLKNIPIIELADSKDYNIWSITNDGIFKLTIHEDDLINEDGTINKKIPESFEQKSYKNTTSFAKYVYDKFVEFTKTIHIEDIDVSIFAKIVSNTDYSHRSNYVHIYVEAANIFLQSANNIRMRSCLSKYVNYNNIVSECENVMFNKYVDYLYSNDIYYITIAFTASIVGMQVVMQGQLDEVTKGKPLFRLAQKVLTTMNELNKVN